MADADPTLDLLRSFDTPGKWVVRRNVPVFRPHTRSGAGGDTIRVTAADLPGIAANMQRIERDSGVVARITAGHVDPRKPEDEQPTLFGFARNARAGTFGPKSTPCVLIDEYLYPEHADKAARLPYRSVEYFPDTKEIRGLALLIRDPFLDLGTVTYTGSGRAYHYAMGDDMAGEAGSAAGAENANTPEPLSPEEEKLAEKFAAHYRAKKYFRAYEDEKIPEKEDVQDKGEYGLGDGSPNQKGQWARAETHNPSVRDEDGEVLGWKRPKGQGAHNAGDREAVQYKAELDRALVRIAQIEHERDTAKCQQLLAGLASEGYQFDTKRELALMLKADEAGRAEHAKAIRTYYQKVPTGPIIPTYSGHVEGGDGPADPHKAPWFHEPAMRYMKGNPGTTYDAAVSHVVAQGKK